MVQFASQNAVSCQHYVKIFKLQRVYDGAMDAVFAPDLGALLYQFPPLSTDTLVHKNSYLLAVFDVAIELVYPLVNYWHRANN